MVEIMVLKDKDGAAVVVLFQSEVVEEDHQVAVVLVAMVRIEVSMLVLSLKHHQQQLKGQELI